MKQKTIDTGYISSFCMELYLILQAGIPLAEGMEILREGERDDTLRQTLSQMCVVLDQGYPLAVALEQAHVFPRYMVDMIGMGEKTGYLDQGLKALSHYYRREEQIAQSLRRAVVYPVVLLSVLLVVMGVLVMEVLPLFADVYSQLGATMSGLGIWMLQFGVALKARWLVVALCLVALIISVAVWSGKERKNGTRVLLSKQLGLSVASAKLASVLSMAFHSGLDLDTSLGLAQTLTQHPVLQTKLTQCKADMDAGASFATAALQAGLFNGLYCRMLGVGVKTGTLDQVMEDIAQRSDATAQDQIDRHIASVEPTLVVMMSVLVGMVLLSVMLPLANIMSSLG